MTKIFVWSLEDYSGPEHLSIRCLLTDNYYAVGTIWPDDDPVWLTRRFDTAGEAHDYAILHTHLLERSGDELIFGPVCVEYPFHSHSLEQLVGNDTPSDTLDRLFIAAARDGVA